MRSRKPTFKNCYVKTWSIAYLSGERRKNILLASCLQFTYNKNTKPYLPLIFLPCYQLIYFKYKTRRITILVAKALNITGHQRVIVSSCIIVSWTGNTPPDKENIFFNQTG